MRRAFLCGEDAYSGRSYEHRRGWVRDRLREVSEQFAVDVYAYAVMSNHLHVVLRTDAERAGDWRAEEVMAGERVMSRYGRLYWRVAGSSASPAAAARAAGQQWFWGAWRRRASEV